MNQTGNSGMSWRRAAAIGWREVHSSPGKFLFVILSVAIGVGALVGVRGFSESFGKSLLRQARTLMAGDISARMFRLPTPDEARKLDALKREGIAETWVTEMVSMASAPRDPVPLLVALKAVDPAQYPFYGSVGLSSDGELSSVLSDKTVIVGEDLLIRLKLNIGDSLHIGDSSFRIADVVRKEPDRMFSGMGLGPRVLMTRSGLVQSGLLQEGSRSSERLLIKLNSEDNDVAAVRQTIEKILPDAQITDFRESNPALTEGLNRSTELLSLICLVAMVLGAIGVAMAMRAHLQQRMDSLAIMKSIGARSGDILRIYLLQTFALGVIGGLLGVLLGLGVEWFMPLMIAKLLPLRPAFHLPIRSVLTGVGTGILTTLLFCLPPLLEIRRVRPSLVLRRMVEESEPGRKSSLATRVGERKVQILAIVILIVALGGIAASLSDSWMVGRWFTLTLTGTLLALLGLSGGLLRVLRTMLNRVRLRLPAVLRHGLANLYRPGNQSSAVLAALGTGVMLILAVFLMQHSVIRNMTQTVGPSIPNVFLVDISSRELDGVTQLVSYAEGITGKPEFVPVVSGRIQAVNGIGAEQLRLQNYPKRLLQTTPLSWSDTLPAGDRIVRGKWWKPGETGFVAVHEHVAERLHLQPGSIIDFLSRDREIRAQVVATFRSDGQHAYGRSEFVLSQGSLQGLPVIWYGAIHLAPNRVASLQRALFASYPTVTVINMADVFSMVEAVVGQITMVVRFLAGFSMLAGVMILASSVASTRFRRIREVVVLKTLGATRNHVLSVFSVEFLVLGLLAGVVGVIFANLLTRVLLHRMQVSFHIEWVATFLALIGTALLAIATGWAASYQILGQKPLEVLREE
jgi:putative ABC transport system permease protein